MRGDAEDVKLALARLLRGPQFLSTLTAIVAEKGDGIFPRLPVAVFEEERLSNNVYPSAELIVYRTMYPESEIVKSAVHSIGVRWTVVGHDEVTVTRHVERLMRTTIDLVWNSTLDMQVSSGPITVTEEDYSPLTPTLDQPFIKSGLVLMDVPTWRS